VVGNVYNQILKNKVFDDGMKSKLSQMVENGQYGQFFCLKKCF
jgi:hypothetical protein